MTGRGDLAAAGAGTAALGAAGGCVASLFDVLGAGAVRSDGAVADVSTAGSRSPGEGIGFGAGAVAEGVAGDVCGVCARTLSGPATRHAVATERMNSDFIIILLTKVASPAPSRARCPRFAPGPHHPSKAPHPVEVAKARAAVAYRFAGAARQSIH